MAKAFKCDDGTLIRADTDEELVSRVEAYIRRAHPHLAGQLSRPQLLELAVTTTPTGGDDGRAAGAR